MHKKLLELKIKTWDIIILTCLLLASFTPWVITSIQHQNNSKVTYVAELRANNKKIRTFDLSKNTTFEYKDKDGDYNKIVVKDGKIRIVEANCADQICVRRGWISQGGQTIVCLPHKLVIEVIASDGNQEGSVIY
ncbi:hypothetical protein SAMN02745116_01362 [Pilibacter termitis]|uniref:Uncharacterized protein n=1 Tax=Pilibacter termitis TaxID=263852 RepID=A0A1T4NBF1_9ENTE|nr:NusG domain II-containing protein [Pilibacter termitis]SJZ76554.1 hypothetical protein SAMN02745116_01362 [Pilibacter termitis]